MSSPGDVVVLEVIDPSSSEDELRLEEAATVCISTFDVETWNRTLLLRSPAVKVRADRCRLVEQSAYFRGLLCGSFSESSFACVSICWNLEGFINVLQFIYGSQPHITSNNILPILEAALYFGVERLLLECETWFCNVTSAKGQLIPLDVIIELWNFGLEHGIGFVPELCNAYLARNFTWIASWSSFPDIPYNLLNSCIEHPLLTIDGEKQLCEALIIWISRNRRTSQVSMENPDSEILKKVRICLLPLEFAAGLRRDFLQLGEESISTILDLMKDYSSSMLHADADKLENLKIRVTEYSEKIILAGCIHITVASILLAVFAPDLDTACKKRVIHPFLELDSCSANNYMNLEKSIRPSAFVNVHEVDISKCPKLQVGATVKSLILAFPSLSILRASHCPQIKMEHLYYLIQNIPTITEVDITVDITPLVPAAVSILYVSIEEYHIPHTTYATVEEKLSLFNVARTTLENPFMSNISKLTFEGRNDINDLDLMKISALCGSLSYLNIKGCTLVTDMGISKLMMKCLNIQSLILSYTSFGGNSIGVLCSNHLLPVKFTGDNGHKYSNTMAFGLQELHIDGCKAVDEDSLSQLMCCVYMLKILILRETSTTDDALYNFEGSCLESLDVSETMVSVQALMSVVRKNPAIRCLKATGCRNLNQPDGNDVMLTGNCNSKDHLFEISRHCILEEMTLGWGFSCISVEESVHLNSLRSITIGLGASPSHHVLYFLPEICPLLESIILIFQVISDSMLRKFQESLKSLRVLHLCRCLGDLTSASFKISMPTLRILRLERVTPWMTNNDLAVLTNNCPHVVEFALSGCRLLDSASQEIISNGWPGLTFIHLEECGKITSNGVSFLFNCKAIEDLLLRHNGKGIGRDFIHDAASKLPLLRKLALDLCDACEEGFDSPSHTQRCFLSVLKISRCKSQKGAFGTSRSVHKNTIVLEWDRKEARTTVVKERI